MTTKPTTEEIQEFLKFFDYKVPDPEHYPKCFRYYVKLFLYYKSINK